MPTDWTTINAEAAAIPGGVPWAAGMRDENGQVVVGVSRNGCIASVWGYRTEKRTGRPDMSDAGTRGHLRAALGSPSIITQDCGDLSYASLLSDDNVVLAAVFADTRTKAEARALITYARKNGGWTVKS